jgi:hypothetical protein
MKLASASTRDRAASPCNQDFHGACVPAQAGLLATKGVVLALADGISSSPVSQVASAAAVRGFLEDYYCTSEAWPVRRAAQRVLAGHQLVAACADPAQRSTASTKTAATSAPSAPCWSSRAARRTCCTWATPASTACTPAALEQLTEDHRGAAVGGREPT